MDNWIFKIGDTLGPEKSVISLFDMMSGGTAGLVEVRGTVRHEGRNHYMLVPLGSPADTMFTLVPRDAVELLFVAIMTKAADEKRPPEEPAARAAKPRAKKRKRSKKPKRRATQFGRDLKKLRQSYGLSQYHVADMCEVPQTRVSEVERGAITGRDPRAREILKKLSAAIRSRSLKKKEK